MLDKVAQAAQTAKYREQIQREINAYKVEQVDRSIYTKTEREKAELYKLKNAWKTISSSPDYIENRYFIAHSDTNPLESK